MHIATIDAWDAKHGYLAGSKQIHRKDFTGAWTLQEFEINFSILHRCSDIYEFRVWYHNYAFIVLQKIDVFIQK